MEKTEYKVYNDRYHAVIALLNLMKMGLFAAEPIGYNPRHLLAIPVMMLWNSAKLPGRSHNNYPKALQMRVGVE